MCTPANFVPQPGFLSMMAGMTWNGHGSDSFS
jgi:hypothetical protein